MTRALTLLVILLIPAPCPCVTEPDLGTRIRIDGQVTEYTDDEWILDGTTVFRESGRDSRWGASNDISRIAATWDEQFLYIAIEGSIHDSRLMTFLEYTGNGVPDMISAGPIRRNIEFFGILPNIVIQASRASLDASVALVSILDPLRYLDPGGYTSRYYQPARGPGAMEIALPWSQVFPEAGYLKLLACVTGGAGTGAGDAAPDPSERLSANHQALAHLDNAITLPVDDNGDGLPDMGVMPRAAVSFQFDQQAPAAADGEVILRLEQSSFAPDEGEVLRFKVDATSASDPVTWYVSAEVYSVTGERVRVLFRDESRVFQSGVEPPWDQWDGRDDRGEAVRGGVYVLLVTGGASPGTASSSAKQSAAVVR